MSDALQEDAPDLTGEPGWTPLARWLLPRGVGRHFLSEGPEDDRIRVRYFRRDEDGAFMGRIWFGPGAEGPPGHAHGGSIAAVLDEVMGLSCWLHDQPVVAARLEVDYRASIPLGRVVTAEGMLEGVHGRKITTWGSLVAADGTILAEGRGLYIRVDEEHLEKLREGSG